MEIVCCRNVTGGSNPLLCASKYKAFRAFLKVFFCAIFALKLLKLPRFLPHITRANSDVGIIPRNSPGKTFYYRAPMALADLHIHPVIATLLGAHAEALPVACATVFFVLEACA